MYPIRFEPIYKDYVWGGSRIARKYSRNIGESTIAESWEISDRKEGMSIVLNGSYKGKTLHDLVVDLGEDLLGRGKKFTHFPLLLKIIDAQENLSIQVHPDDVSAPRLGGEAKSEMWVLLEKGTVYAGFKEDINEAALYRAIESNQVEPLLNKLDLDEKEAVYIPGGRVHSICAGSLIYEVQQNSNTTYRLYDWGREGRELHLKNGIDAIDWKKKGDEKLIPLPKIGDQEHEVFHYLRSPYFSVDRLKVFNKLEIAPLAHSFQIFFCIEGEGEIVVDSNGESFKMGSTYLVPAASQSICIQGPCEALRIQL